MGINDERAERADAEAFEESSPAWREVRFEYSRDFPRILEHLGATLLVSTYQAGKLVVIGVREGRLTFAFHAFERVMGVAASPQRIAVGTRKQVYFLHAAHEFASGVAPQGTYDACWLARHAHVTGNIHGHELAFGTDGLWMVNTLFSCLVTLLDEYSFVPRWRPPFISELAGQDRCHLNGLAMQDGQPRFVTAHAESNEPAGWRSNKAASGCVIDVPSGRTLVRGLCMPHSPRWHQGRLWALDSGTGRLIRIDPATGRMEPVEQFPGYTRGLAMWGPFAFVGLSKIRETSVFGGVPIAERRDELRCGVAAVDLQSGRAVAWVQFHSGVDEVFAVEVLPGCTNPVLCGPATDEDGQPDIWVVPPERTGAAQPPPSQLSPAARGAETLARLKAAVETAPQRADLLNELGNAYQSVGDQDAALATYRRAVRVAPQFVPARQNLGYLLFNQGEPELALEQYEAAQRVEPSPMNRLLAATVLPVVYDSVAEVQRWRQRLAASIRALADEGVRIDTARSQVPTNFFWAYQGENNRPLAADLGRIYQGVDLGGARRPQSGGGRIRVGFLSAYFRDHTIGRLNLGRIRHLARDRIEVTVLDAGPQEDETTQAFAQAADRFAAIPRDVAAARRQIADLGLDILVFADVGMDALCSTLAYSRMAPIQCVTWGHPDTTGSPMIDYFLSSELLETPDADTHYTERLIRLPNLGIYYERPRRQERPRDRASFGLAPDQHVYACLQTAFKFHPAFDAALAGILHADPQGELVLLEGRVANWTTRLKRRLAAALGDAFARVRFLAPLPQPEFLDLLAAADVALDPFPFGGGNTSYEALAIGTPVVTWPGPYLRGRITLALYRKLGWTACVTDSVAGYVALATRLATERSLADSARETIRATSHILFEDLDEVRAIEAFLCSVVG